MDHYIEGNKAAWEEAFDNRAASWGADITERIQNEEYPFFNEDTKNAIRDIVKDSYREGLNGRTVAKEITKQCDEINKTRGRTIARTEIKQAQTTANYITNKARGANCYDYVCGHNPCDLCEEDCGSTFPIEDLDHLPPRHPNCMCSVSFRYDPNLEE